MIEINKDDLVLEPGRVAVKGSPSRSVGLGEDTKACSNEGVILRQEGWFKYPDRGFMYGQPLMASAALKAWSMWIRAK